MVWRRQGRWSQIPSFWGALGTPSRSLGVRSPLLDATADTSAPGPGLMPGPRPHLALVLDALDAQPDPATRLCLDFGSASSKGAIDVFGRGPRPLRLCRPEIDAREGFVVDSCLAVDASGCVWFGPAAHRASLASGRPRLDSLKALLGFVLVDQDWDAVPLASLGISWCEGLSLGDGIRALLAWLTWRVDRASSEHHRSWTRLRRSFSLPCWPLPRARRFEMRLARLFAEAILIADTLGAELDSGLRWPDLVEVCRRARRASRVPHRLIGPAVLEPLAVVRSRFAAERSYRGLVAVVDLGAGTTDLALTVVEADPEQGRLQIAELPEGRDLVGCAGNAVDRALAELVLQRIGRRLPGRSRRRLERDIRAAKERLVMSGRVQFETFDGVALDIERRELLEHPSLRSFEGILRARIQARLDRLPGEVRRRWADDGLTVCVAGGSAMLPPATALVRGRTESDGLTFVHRPGPGLPDFVVRDPAVEVEYPRLAVALGGVMPPPSPLARSSHLGSRWGSKARPEPEIGCSTVKS